MCSDLGVELWEKSVFPADLLWVVLSQGGECGVGSRKMLRTGLGFSQSCKSALWSLRWASTMCCCWALGTRRVNLSCWYSSGEFTKDHAFASSCFSSATQKSHCGQPSVWSVECMHCFPFQDSWSACLPPSPEGMLFIDFKSFWEPTFHGSLSKYCSS